MAQATKLLLPLSFPDTATSPNATFNSLLLLSLLLSYPPSDLFGGFDKRDELKGSKSLKVLQKTVINVNFRGFHNIHESSWVKPEPQGTKGLQGIHAPDTQNTFELWQRKLHLSSTEGGQGLSILLKLDMKSNALLIFFVRLHFKVLPLKNSKEETVLL